VPQGEDLPPTLGGRQRLKPPRIGGDHVALPSDTHFVTQVSQSH